MESSNVMINSFEYGGSNPVENVQALASKSPKKIPPRYLRCEAEVGEVSNEKQCSFQIPIIDMAKLVDDYDRQRPFDNDELAKLHSACKDYGFFQLINHGVPEELIENMKISVDEFFELPLEEKKLYSQLPNSIEGYGQAFVVSDEQKLDWGDMFYITTRPISKRNNRFWPTNPTCFRENLDKYSFELHKVGTLLLKFMSRNLGLNSNSLSELFESGRQSVRINVYPPCGAHSNKVLGISPHSDASGLTLLLQANDVQGLQIINNGTWIRVIPIPGAFIINIGDIIEIISNGEYKSIEHRVIVNPEKTRLSIATFHCPNINATIGPLLDLVKYPKANYKSLSYEDYLRLLFSTKLDGKNLLNQMKMEN